MFELQVRVLLVYFTRGVMNWWCGDVHLMEKCTHFMKGVKALYLYHQECSHGFCYLIRLNFLDFTRCP